MPAIIQLGAIISCPHGGMASVIPTQSRVLTGGTFALLPTDTYLIAGCAFMVGPKPQPCLSIAWQAPSTGFSISGQPVLLASSIGLCKSAEGIPQGPATISGAQTKASGR